jgi:modification methylase
VNLALNQIRMDGGTQSRAQLDWVAIDEYAASMKEGEQFPPVTVYYDGTEYWLADGFHRMRAAQKAGLTEIAAEVRQGTQRDAILCSVGANAENGVRRTHRDIRQAVEMLLRDEVWKGWSNPEIALHCRTNQTLVWRMRKALEEQGVPMPEEVKYFANGKVYTQSTKHARQPATPFLAPPLESESCSLNNSLTRADTATPTLPIPELTPISRATTLPTLILNRDARYMGEYLTTESAHLIITSPPYNVGIDYDAHEDDLSSYYNLLTDIWGECYGLLVDGGRICVNVPFGVGRNPWVPMALDVMRTLTDAGFTLRGQIIWDKNTTGNRTSWGSFRLPTDPGLRDTTECVIVAHKGQSNLEIPAEYRLRDEKGSYTAWLADSDYFMELAQDHWQIAPESAQRIKHPAPFPTELVRRLIHFYGFPGCHVVDPFAGSGTVGVVAKQLGCQATLFEISQDYCRLAEERINEQINW